jgi:hypothetical protein
VTEPGQQYASGNALQNPRDPIDYRNLINSVYWSSGTKVWDATHGAQYIRYDTGNSSQDAFVSYTGVEQISEAAKYVAKAKLGGIMTYDLAGEYIASQSGDARYPLSTAIYQALTGSSPSSGSGSGSGSQTPSAASLTVQVTPTSGSGQNAKLTVSATDSKGYKTITQVSLFAGTPGKIAHSCYLDIDPINNSVALRNDADSGWSQGSVGGSGTLSNSQCQLPLRYVSVTRSGNVVSVVLPITFSASYSNSKSILVYAADNSGVNTGWQSKGTWN